MRLMLVILDASFHKTYNRGFNWYRSTKLRLKLTRTQYGISYIFFGLNLQQRGHGGQFEGKRLEILKGTLVIFR